MSIGVSVILPVLEPHPIYFREAIESIIAQTFTSWELIIVEDPSTFSAESILREYSDDRIHHYLNPRRTSLVAQLNLALSLAKYDYIARMDADDISEPDRLREQIRFLGKNPPVGVIGCQKVIIGSAGEQLGYRNYPVSHDAIAKAMRRYNAIAHPGVTFRRGLIELAGGYSNEPHHQGAEDFALWWRLLRAGVRFANHPSRLLRYRVQPQQTKSQRLKMQLRSTLAIKRENWDDSFDLGDSVRYLSERALLMMPPSIVMRLFMASSYRR